MSKQSVFSESAASTGVSVIVMAHNEEARIGICLASLKTSDPDIAIHVVVNGSTDRTADIARDFKGVTVHEYTAGGKARSWNRIMLDTPGIEANTYVFVDGDAELKSGAVQALVRTLRDTGSNAVAGFPGNGRQVQRYRNEMTAQHGLFGDLYALSGDFVTRFRAKHIRLPDDLIGDDSLIGAMAKTDLHDESDWSEERVALCASAEFLCEPVDWSLASLQKQYNRMRNYSLRHFQNRIISHIMREKGPDGLPHKMQHLYAEYLPQFKARRDWRYWWFDSLALAQMHAAVATSPKSH